jgi:gamma-glutamyltranspeptidase
MAAIATPHRLASAAGVRALEAGGSAADAALAAAAVLTVVYPHNCALGGDLFALVRQPDGEVVVVNASGPAPAGVDVARLQANAGMPATGIDAVTVPGLVGGWAALHRLAGRRAWDEDLRDAVAFARDGFEVTQRLADAIEGAPGVVDDPGMRAVFGGVAAGRTLRQPALAETSPRWRTAAPARSTRDRSPRASPRWAARSPPPTSPATRRRSKRRCARASARASC